jgi:hypothetical protein
MPTKLEVPMIRSFVTALILTSTIAAAEPKTLRVDYYHTGNMKQELFALDKVVVEPLAWPGNPHRPIDDSNLGDYRFEIRDAATKQPLYSCGFCSIYREWVTTDEAKSLTRTFHESVRFPAPEKPVKVVVQKRDAKNGWTEAWSTTIDPKNQFVDRAVPDAPGELLTFEKNGPSAEKVDLLILGDGYTAAERPKFEADAKRLVSVLFATPPFQSRRKDFNVWGLCPAAKESGISRPSTGVHKASPLGCTYDAFGSERYVLTFDNKAFRTAASFAPYDAAVILVNGNTYGGGGIYNLYTTTAAGSLWAPYIFVHEFGHHFAGLADEYYTSPVAYNPPATKIEPWEPNVTAVLDPAKLKWKDLSSASVPVPTPWRKEEYDTLSRDFQKRRAQIRKDRRPEADMDALFLEEKKTLEPKLAAEAFAGKVGAFEGAGYATTGLYRPSVNCIMFTRTEAFCPVCRRTIERAIDRHTANR